ncbi:MAG TPA: AAA family ATPase, partial [Patescibacteria group bacterium]|nr:AAA family ATPase [Patescibacteria group bacterium]
ESFDCSEETTADKIIGQWVVIGTEMQFIDGHVTSAMRNGFVLLENEADFMRPELRGEVHGIMDKGGQITLHAIHPKTKKIFREKLYRHPNFRWVSTANTTGYGDDLFAFHGTQYMNAASRDRYETIIKVDFKKEEEEVLILKKKTGIDEDTAEKMVRIANDCRQSQNSMIFQFTLRRLLAWAKYWQLSGEVPATDMCVLNYCNITDRHTVASLVRTHLALDVS